VRRIHVSLLLEGECGYDEVLALRFRYNAELVALLKRALWAAREGRKSPVGGWSPEDHCWWVEGDAWPAVRQRLLDAGCELAGPRELIWPKPEPKPAPPKPEPQGFYDLTKDV
jgi:hypothetical protein